MGGIDYIEVDFGERTRKLRYGVTDVRDLCQTLGNITLVALLGRLAEMDVNAILHCIRHGLAHEEPRMTLRAAGDLLTGHIRKHGDASKVLTAISDALDATGLISLRATSTPSGEASGAPAA